MASNPYVNRVQKADGTTIIDISDTTAITEKVDSSAYFYNASGEKLQGSGRMNMWANGDVSITSSNGYVNLNLVQQLPAGRYTILCKNVTSYTGDDVIITFHSIAGTSGQAGSNRVGSVKFPVNSTSSATFELSDTAKSVRVEAADSTSASSGQTATYSDIFLMLEPLSGFQAVTGVTPTESSQTIEPDPGVAGLSSVQIDAIPSTYVGSAVKNVQVYSGYSSVASSAYTATDVSLTVKKAGVYTISWTGWRNTTGGTSGSQLYINDTAYGTAVTTFDLGSYNQHVLLAAVSLAKNDMLVVRARARSSSYSMTVADLVIEEK